MKMLLIVHKDDERLAAFIEAVRTEKLSGFTLLPSQGVGRAVAPGKSFDFFVGGLAGLFSDGRIENATALSFVDDNHVPRLLELMQKHLTDLDEPGGGVYAVLPVDQAGSL